MGFFDFLTPRDTIRTEVAAQLVGIAHQLVVLNDRVVKLENYTVDLIKRVADIENTDGRPK